MHGNKRNKNRWLLFGLALLMLTVPIPLKGNPGDPPNATTPPALSPIGDPVLRILPEEPLAPNAPK